MSKREKITTLYSRNGIRITKTDNIQNGNFTFGEFTRQEKLENFIANNKTGNYVTVKHESPLGFYYYTRKFESIEYKKPKYVEYKKYVICLYDKKYELEYPIGYFNGNEYQKINVDFRPWDVCPGYKGIPDNMIIVLLREANKFLDILFEYKNNIKMKLSFNDYRKNIMIDLFGYENGPKIQPNNIKILSHGFDLKESFRKRKEI